ncbi:hypothetical protein I0C86_07035 [Plantactinospora sp. S1510]|uniref:Lipoprotein n=1 Tax=Plantactinospora alkalitolerans TaxID=2789879 RepID=A0ABS0GS77_9ACTN|nr:hypothetical protein [Plantactinospora alkalitolerans]MBF9128742.1 hypothetical protein [Plantactinospora alkalitolerans]
MAILTKKQRPLLVLSAFALVLAMGSAGCDDGEDPSVASVSPGGTNSRTGGTDDNEPSPLKFSQCMRDQGFTWYPDPDAGGNLSASEPEGLDRAKYQQAQQTCEVYAPWGSGNSNKKSPEDLEKLRQMSQCMRDHGFATFPDPDENGGINISKNSGISPDDPAVQKAQEECQKYFPTGQDR